MKARKEAVKKRFFYIRDGEESGVVLRDLSDGGENITCLQPSDPLITVIPAYRNQRLLRRMNGSKHARQSFTLDGSEKGTVLASENVEREIGVD
ncbi:hypothetical protein PGTUg99_033944 [Puccinia graminis f. sp. tritici]|uniref:Uncharacterized protein n=1 Tax=Puccinia graminis f. sp. tritici TaxID=56615 RepID=A0A5B0Q9W5_PUCGR|nr:hypothetical protein PGTUg99_033944 [Puccinia graminis f. sp. tritici]